MKVNIQDLGVAMDVKTKGVEFRIRENNGDFLGDLFVTSTGLVWCEGRTAKENGVKITWKEFIEMMTEN